MFLCRQANMNISDCFYVFIRHVLLCMYAIYISIPDWLYDSPLGIVFEMPSLSFMSTRLWLGFGGHLVEVPLLLSVFMGVWTLGLSLSLTLGTCTMGAPIFTIAFGGSGNISSGISICHNINHFHWYLTPYEVDTTYDLGVSSPGVDITVASCHSLTFRAFCSHTGCWGRSGGSSLAWALCPV